MNNSKIFTDIYSHSRWTNNIEDKFNSGLGSSLDEFVDPYVQAINKLVESLEYTPSVFDLGCGNFNVGSKLRPLFIDYYAGDIVEYLIENNKEKFKNLNVNFLVVDAEVDNLPDADIVMIRQVFQHLSNNTIQIILNKLKKYKYVIITEHDSSNIVEYNLDKITGPGIRYPTSAVDISQTPFNYSYKSAMIICIAKHKSVEGFLKTIVYEN